MLLSALRSQRQARRALFAGVYDEGVFATFYGGDVWLPASDGLPSLKVRCLDVDQEEGGLLFAGLENASTARMHLGPPSFLEVLPAEGFSAAGPHGGPFVPTSGTFTLSNTSSDTLTWTADGTPSWLTLSKTTGAIEAAGSDVLSVSVRQDAAPLPSGLPSQRIVFTNVQTGGVVTRRAKLEVRPMSGFDWGLVLSPQKTWAEFDVAIPAVDSEGQRVTTFDDTVTVRRLVSGEVAIDTGSRTWPDFTLALSPTGCSTGNRRCRPGPGPIVGRSLAPSATAPGVCSARCVHATPGAATGAENRV